MVNDCVCYFFAIADPPGVVEATFKYGWIDSLQLMNFGKMYTCVSSMYAFLMAAASSSQVYASCASTIKIPQSEGIYASSN